jgi:hypothetical protein
MCGNKGKYCTEQQNFRRGNFEYMPAVGVSPNGFFFRTNVYWFFYLFVITQHFIRIMNDNIVTMPVPVAAQSKA